MLGFLFRTLTSEPARGAALFGSASAIARRPHWYVAGAVPDTLDGRFALLATVLALILVRLEQEGEPANPLSVALTERFIAVMESEHRELGLGDPALGKRVRKLVGSLAGRTDLWRDAVAGERDWAEATRESLYRKTMPSGEAVSHSAKSLGELWASLRSSNIAALCEGNIA
jgi:cytochrome b pre-mRNA-processing protein 3